MKARPVRCWNAQRFSSLPGAGSSAVQPVQPQRLVSWEMASLFTGFALSCDLGVGVGVDIWLLHFGGKKETSRLVTVADNKTTSYHSSGFLTQWYFSSDTSLHLLSTPQLGYLTVLYPLCVGWGGFANPSLLAVFESKHLPKKEKVNSMKQSWGAWHSWGCPESHSLPLRAWSATADGHPFPSPHRAWTSYSSLMGKSVK